MSVRQESVGSVAVVINTIDRLERRNAVDRDPEAAQVDAFTRFPAAVDAGRTGELPHEKGSGVSPDESVD